MKWNMTDQKSLYQWLGTQLKVLPVILYDNAQKIEPNRSPYANTIVVNPQTDRRRLKCLNIIDENSMFPLIIVTD